MNPLTNMKNVVKLSEQELKNTSKSTWHDQYKDSAWIFIGGLPYDLTEGDIICIFSQYGEIVNINLIREKDTGKSKGFCFLCYEDQRSTILAVDNFNGIKVLKRIIRVDHVQEYKVPKEGKTTDEEIKKLYTEGCAPKSTTIAPKIKTPKQDIRETLADQIEGDMRLPARLPIYTNIKGEKISDSEFEKKIKKEKKEKNKKKDKKKSKKKKSKKTASSTDEAESNDSESERINIRIKTEQRDTRTSSEDKDRSKSDNRERQSDSRRECIRPHRSDKSSFLSDYSSSRNKDDKKNSHRSNRSRSKDRLDKSRTRKGDVSPNIPKRWR